MQPLYGHMALEGCYILPGGHHEDKNKNSDREKRAYAKYYSGNQEYKVCEAERQRYQQIEDVRVGLFLPNNMKQ